MTVPTPSLFATLAVPEPFVAALSAQGIAEPTAVQQAAIPPAIQGHSLLAQSQTGTGKTLAYLLPLLARLEAGDKHLQAIVLAPTHELAMQIADQARRLVQGTEIRVQALIGGAAIARQIERLKLKPQLVIGSPGRIKELIDLRKLKLHQVKTVVLDEVDRLLDPKARPEVEAILKATPRQRQLIGVSATLPAEVATWADQWATDVTVVRTAPSDRPAETLSHVMVSGDPRVKIDDLRRLVHAVKPKAAIAFVKDPKRMVELLDKLAFKGLTVASLHRGEHKEERAQTLRRFRSGDITLLIATDLAARGLDLPNVDLVVNFDLPTDPQAYLHRAGRTGRMGAAGLVATLVAPHEAFIVDRYAKDLQIPIMPATIKQGQLVIPATGDPARG